MLTLDFKTVSSNVYCQIRNCSCYFLLKLFLALYPQSRIHLAQHRTKPDGLPEIAWSAFNELRSFQDVAALNVEEPYGPIPDSFQVGTSLCTSVIYIQ